MTDRRRDGEITRLVSARSSRPLVASHPVYQYPARRYQLNVVSLHWEPDEPSQRPDVAGAGGGAWRRPARFMLWEDQRMAEFWRRLQGRGVRNV